MSLEPHLIKSLLLFWIRSKECVYRSRPSWNTPGVFKEESWYGYCIRNLETTEEQVTTDNPIEGGA